ncbi:MAG: T9SS type A sorting domain-containing protein, partial [Bacteroidetes bacterium]
QPNPFRESFVVVLDYDGSGTADFELTDTGGRIVMRRSEELTPGRNMIQFDCRHLAAGVYNLRITYEGRSITRKVIRH